MSVDLSSLPKRVAVAVGRRSEIPLPSYSGSGNRWSVQCLSGGDVVRVWVEPDEAPPIAASPGDGIAEPPALMLVPDRAVVSGVSPGEAMCRLVLARPFGPSTPTAMHDFHVTVVAALPETEP
ncbi:MAG: hypothetical protein WCB68_18560 [Pyrinomonadaceae bacterium]